MKNLALLFSTIIPASAGSGLRLFVTRRVLGNQINERQTSRVRWFSRGQFLLVYLALALPVMAAFSQRQKIRCPDVPRGVGAQFGNAVAMDGNTMVVGARFDSTTATSAGSAFVYVLNGGVWTLQAQLLANDGATFDKFGQSVAISGDTIVVGAYQDDAPLSNGGSAYVFVRNGTTWTQQQKLTASDGTADDEFGNAVAIIGGTVIVGAHFADLPGNSAAGSAYVYTRSGTFWTQTQKLIPTVGSNGSPILGDSFGESLAVSGTKLVVGSDHADIPETAAGAVYVFAAVGSGTYSLEQKLFIADGTNGDLFGFSVAIEGNTLVGGAREDAAASGAAYVFEFNGATWTQQQKLTASDGAASDRFGWSVAVSNNVVAVGAREDDTGVGPDAGSAYVFTRSSTTWTQQQKLAPGDPFNGDRFGSGVALSLGQLVVGAAEKPLTNPDGQGAVYAFGPRPVFPDFDGDKKADLSFYDASSGNWQFMKSSDSSVVTIPFGTQIDLMVPADFDGDGKTDSAVFRPSSGTWFCLSSLFPNTFTAQSFGLAGDLPMPGDFDGDGRADLSVFRPSTGAWLRINSSNSQPVTVVQGAAGDIPLIADFDGDGKSDISYYRPSNGNWGILRSSDNSFSSTQFGASGDSPAPADYDGDGKTDLAVFRPSSGTWFVLNSTNGSVLTTPLFGIPGDKPVPADYDGDGLADVAVFRPSSGTWFLQTSPQSFMAIPFGNSNSQPVPLFFVRQVVTVQFSASNYTVSEGSPRVDIALTRSGDTTSSASVSFATNDGAGLQNCNVTNGIASPRCDYTNTLGTMTFAAGETSKTFSIAIVDDSYVEGNENFTVSLNTPSGATLGAQATATVTINDNDSSNGTNPIDSTNFFVRQQYIDFLGREPDPPGLAGWTSTINNCAPGDTNCDRIHVSQLFFQSAEFQDRGYFVYRFYPVAFGRKPDYAEFVADLARVSGFLDNNQLEAAKVQFIADFMARPAFASAYNGLTNQQYVDALLNTAAVTLSSRQAMIDGLNNSTLTRAQVLRQIVESSAVATKYNHQAYAVMEYFGYLRRQPDAFYLDWIAVLDQSNDPRGMVTGFATSAEYRQRFGP